MISIDVFFFIIIYLFILFFYSVLRPFQDYFNSYETDQSVGGEKTGEPREKTPGTPASRTWLVSCCFIVSNIIDMQITFRF